MPKYPVPLEEERIELRVVNSTFIASLAPVFSVEQAKAFVSRIREEFSDASHNVPVYLVGHGSREIAHSSDDGEPSGTAGRPALAVLRGSGLGDVAVVVTRYFGGTKLGTGGLVRAYSEAVRQVVEKVRRAEKVLTHTVMIGLSYSLFEQVRLLATARGGEILDQDFAAEVTMTLRFPVERLADFQEGLLELSNGSLQAEIIDTQEILFPLPG